MTSTRSIFGVALFAVACWSAPAIAEDDRQTRTWAAACAACHGTEGRATTGIPAIAGQDADRLFTALKEFKNDQRPATVMDQHAKGYTDEELQRLADYFARQTP